MRTVRVGASRIATVDDEDDDVVRAYRWRPITPRNVTYAVTTLPRARGHGGLYLHTLIARRMGLDGPVDHKDGDGLNNRRANIRPCTAARNGANVQPRPGASLFKGVTYTTGRAKWRAYVRINRRQVHLGSFDTQEDAARAYNAAAREEWGDYAYLNEVI